MGIGQLQVFFCGVTFKTNYSLGSIKILVFFFFFFWYCKNRG